MADEEERTLVLRTNMLVFSEPGTYVWTKPADLHSIGLILKGAGGSGSSGVSHPTTNQRRSGSGGGGGAVVVPNRRIYATELPDTVTFTVGEQGGPTDLPGLVSGAWVPGNNGGDSEFFGFRAGGGLGGGWTHGATEPVIGVGGSGGYSTELGRGGSGVGDGQNNSVSTTRGGEVRLLAGGAGGGRGWGYNAAGTLQTHIGGAFSSLATGVTGTWRTDFGLVLTSGNGASGGQVEGQNGYIGSSPGGGGGGGAGGWPAGRGGRGGNGQVVIFEYIKDIVEEE